MSAMVPRRYVHIGYPKCASTSLQVSFFPSHPQICHLGNGYLGRPHRYIDRNVGLLAEVDLRFRRELSYDPRRGAAALQTHFGVAKALGYRAVGLSSEFLSLTLQNEIDVVTKAQRLHALFGNGTRIVMVIREQLSLLRSLYLEFVKGGYGGTYADFLRYTYLFQDRNWCTELCYDRLVIVYRSIFGAENVSVVPFEVVRDRPDDALTELCDCLGVTKTASALARINETGRMTLSQYEGLRVMNNRYPHGCGSPFYQPFDCRRIWRYFKEELGVSLPHAHLTDDLVHKNLWQLANRPSSHPWPDIDLTPCSSVTQKLERLYAESNRRMQDLSSVDLASLGYEIA
jgi:hypothetical protein